MNVSIGLVLSLLIVEQRSCRIENGNLNYKFPHNLTIDRFFSSFFVHYTVTMP